MKRVTSGYEIPLNAMGTPSDPIGDPRNVKPTPAELMRYYEAQEEVENTSYEPSGFTSLVVFHQLLGISYNGYNENMMIRIITIFLSVVFTVTNILIHVPCLFNCIFDVRHLFGTEGLSPEFVSFALVYLEVYHVFMCDIVMIMRGSRIRKFFKRMSEFSDNFSIKLTDEQNNKLSSTVLKLIIINIVHMVAEFFILFYLVGHKVTRWPGKEGATEADVTSQKAPERENDEPRSNSTLTPIVDVNVRIFYIISLVVKTLTCIHSKVMDTILVYLAKYLTLMLKRLEVRYDKFVYDPKGEGSLEFVKVAFIEMQNLIKEADDVFSHTAFDPLFMNVLMLLAGILVFSDGIGRRRALNNNDYHEIFNSFICLVSLYLCCAYGDEVEEEMVEVIQTITYINVEAFSETDYRAYNLLVTIANGKLIVGMTAGRFFSLNKRFFFWLIFGTLAYFMIIICRGLRYD